MSEIEDWRAIDAYCRNPRPGAVYNIGGGKENSVSVLESIDRVEQLLGKKMKSEYTDQNRIGGHTCYYSDLSRLKADYPEWSLTHSIDDIFEEFARAVS